MTAKINNTSIKIKSIVPRVSKKLSVQRPPGQNSDAIEGLGSQGAELQISLQADTLAEKHAWTAEFLQTGPQVLTDPDGYIYNIVESQASGGRNYTQEPNEDKRWLFGFQCLMEEPFKFSSTVIERIKTITTNGQEWSADNSAVDITTLGTVDVIPDIKVEAGAYGSNYTRVGAEYIDVDPTVYSDTSGTTTYNLKKTVTLAANVGRKWHISDISFSSRNTSGTTIKKAKVTIQAASLYSGVETTLHEENVPADNVYHDYAYSEDITSAENEVVTIRYYLNPEGTGLAIYIKDITNGYESFHKNMLTDITIYNTADTTRKTQMCNEIMPGTIVEILKNGTGTFNYVDSFTSDTYKYVSIDYNNVSYDAFHDRILIASGGSITYIIDTKYPITGIPVIVLNMYVGVVGVSIARNENGIPGTFYDIDGLTGIDYDDETVSFLLDNLTTLRLKGETSFFIKIYESDGFGIGLNAIDISTDIVTIDTLLPYVYLGATNTFRADQNSDSSLNATVTLNYRDAHWVI